ncbi:hypothetical protein C0J52_26584 [Blattella germanica]|nr:hypothetical protein C0J52_26584 [Blattella germanica]
MYKVKEEKEDVLSGEPTELESAVIKDEHEYMDKSPDIESLTQVLIKEEPNSSEDNYEGSAGVPFLQVLLSEPEVMQIISILIISILKITIFTYIIHAYFPHDFVT